MRSDLLDGLLFLNGFQRDSCFHFRAEVSPLPRFHYRSVSEAVILHLIGWSEFWGAFQELAIELAGETHKLHPEVGGPNQIAWLQGGRVSNVVQQSFAKPKPPLPFKFMKNFGAEGDGTIGDLSPLLCVECNFKKMHIGLGGNYFVGTTFEDVVLVYDRGQAVLDKDNKLVRCVLKLGPHADITSPLVQHLIHGFQWLRIDYDENVPYPLRVPS
jgi:hypothetical protein